MSFALQFLHAANTGWFDRASVLAVECLLYSLVLFSLEVSLVAYAVFPCRDLPIANDD